MNTRRVLLDALADGPVSGPALADRLDVSRAAVWKQVEALREAGFRIASTDDGYVVRQSPEYGAEAVAFGLDAPYAIEYYESIGSTNARAREIATDDDRLVGGEAGDDEPLGGSGYPEGVVVLANEQTGGRGRLDREWTAPPGGVYLSLLRRPSIPPAQAPVFTLAAAVATARACREARVDAHIKWPNDVLVGDEGAASPDPVGEEGRGTGRGGRKLAGILTEMEGEADRVSWLVVGVGVNANVDAETLPVGATSLRSERGTDVDRRLFVQRLLESIHELTADGSGETVLREWREHASTLGRRVRVETPGGVVVGKAIDIEFPGALVVDTDDGVTRVLAGDCEHLRPL